MAQIFQGFFLNLPHALASELELLAEHFERVRPVTV
jgi:hypothetical protein